MVVLRHFSSFCSVYRLFTLIQCEKDNQCLAIFACLLKITYFLTLENAKCAC